MTRPKGIIETEGRHIVYKDKGCKFYCGSCLECPFSDDFCIDDPEGRLWLELNKEKVILILKGLGKKNKEIINLLNLSEFEIKQYLKRRKNV